MDGFAPVRVELLGPLRLVVDGVPVDVRGPKQRAVLVLLALAESRIVPVDRLVDALWPAEVPESGRQALHSQIHRLRGQLAAAAGRLRTLPDGYLLELGDDGLDLTQARALLAAARRDPAGAFARLRRAHGLWRGPVLADLGDVEPIAAAIEGCARLRREVIDALVAAGLAEGEAAAVAGLAAASVAAEPLREPAVLLSMRALAATGQAPEALRVAAAYRRQLVEETGLDPSPALDALVRDVAAGAAGPPPPSMAAPAPPSPSPRPAPPMPSPSPMPPMFRSAPHPATRLFGRDGQVGALHRLLATERLVTLVGPGGVGKTRVALEVARSSDVATVLPLAPVTDPAALPHALAAALDLEVVQGDVLAACAAVLGARPGLLMIDNCEHLLDAAHDAVGALLSRCPRLTVLATSREPLGLAAEYVWRLAPLPLPRPSGQALAAPAGFEAAADPADPAGLPDSANPTDRGGQTDPVDPAGLARVPSVALFLERAGRVRPGLAPTPGELWTVADIVRRLDGMPLAIELAAGRLSAFSFSDLRDRLDRSLDLLGGGRPSGDPRHRTLRATIEWSYRLLTADERRLFRHLSVFVDGVGLDTAERLAADLGLAGDPGGAVARLVDTSMINADFAAGQPRYRMLETLRAFGVDRLAAAGEDEAAAGHLLRWACRFAGWFDAVVRTEREPEADAALRRELPSLRAAWRLARDRGDLDAAAALVVTLYDAIAYRDLIEIRGWAEELAADPAMATHRHAAPVFGAAADALYHRGAYAQAERLARIGLALATDDAARSCCLLPLSISTLARGAYAETIEHSLAAFELDCRPRENLGVAALAATYAGDLERARRLNERGSVVSVSPSSRAWDAYVAGEVENHAGRDESAEERYTAAIDLARGSGATFLVGIAAVGLLTVRARAGRVDEALAGYREVIDYFARTGNWIHLWTTLRNLADLLRRLGDHAPAALLAAAADHAPDASAVADHSAVADQDLPARVADGDEEPRGTMPSPAASPGRAEVLAAARQAITRNLGRT
ncbi:MULTISPECIES: AfsR/SARP family transcriptional regulator [Pseudofrankia]|uniref:AfsR/SARP family transcriptional regulator n=1 Tax=Pseudofrankia TaxID=2994363 RepID=UPI0002F95553|nr:MULTISPECIES: BTAD domain-containing putative transcriptional regulator [Pseudofrankia]